VETALALDSNDSHNLILNRTFQTLSSELLTMIFARVSITNSSRTPLETTAAVAIEATTEVDVEGTELG
jgi:hypothetical protein